MHEALGSIPEPNEPSTVMHACNPGEVEAVGSDVGGHPQTVHEILSQRKERADKKRRGPERRLRGPEPPGCSPRAPGFNSHHQHGGSSPSITSVPGHPSNARFWPLQAPVTHVAQMCMQAKHAHTHKMK